MPSTWRQTHKLPHVLGLPWYVQWQMISRGLRAQLPRSTQEECSVTNTPMKSRQGGGGGEEPRVQASGFSGVGSQNFVMCCLRVKIKAKNDLCSQCFVVELRYVLFLCFIRCASVESHMVQRLGFLVFTQAARVRLPVWE